LGKAYSKQSLFRFNYPINTGDAAIGSPLLPRKEPLSPSIKNFNVPPRPPKIQLEAVPLLPPKVEIEVPDNRNDEHGEYSDGKSDSEGPIIMTYSSFAITNAVPHTTATTESGDPLRRVNTPLSILDRFLDIAAKNTRNNLETCGILCGHLVRNKKCNVRIWLPISHLLSDIS
jgi:STAM-binding protein